MKKQLHFTFLILSISISPIFGQNQFFNGDVIAKGSMQIGGSAQNGYSFGFDTFVMSEDNLRMLFNDTSSSSSSFPSNDWRFTFNDSSNGGDNYFSIDDATGGKKPFRIDAGAPNNAFRIADNGNIGIGTNNPGSIELNITDGDTPTMRLTQDGSMGYKTQSWDLAGNETNFFIRDVTNGSKLPFKIQPNTPTNTLALGKNGNVGIGFGGNNFPNINADASIDLKATDQGLLINRMTTDQRTTFGTSLDTNENGMMVYDSEENKVYLWNGDEWKTDTDAQDLELSGNTLSVSNDASAVDLSKYLDNTDDQTVDVFELDGNTLELSLERDGEATKTVDFSGFMDNTDAQDLDLYDNVLSLSNDVTPVDLSDYLDNTDSQELSLATNTLSISGGTNTIDLSNFLDNTDAQDLDLSDNVLSLSNGATTVDLSDYLDNTDSQELSLATNTLSISGGTNTIDLSNFLDNTDVQDLDISDNVLSLSNDATPVDLSGYLDNTDNQELSLATNTLSISGGTNTIDLSNFLDNTDAQTLMLTNTDLSISGGNSIDLSSLRDGIGTDNQTLDLQTNALSITNGNTIDLSRYVNTDSQNLTGATLNESNLTIEIENGNAVTVNLNPIIASLENELVNTQQEVEDLIVENTTQQTIINELIARIEALEQNTTGIQDPTTRSNTPILYQNIPNPFNETSMIRYYLPEGTLDASIIFSTMTGQVFSKVALTQTGEGELNITSSGLAQGTYFFTLYVGRTKIDTKKMVIK